ncbi:periplasmic chaperone for outer membrane proteins Skp [Mariprofundus ferrinatatus]|uniref:Periplasmic chaperone for outer membrane proteins Skp n=1 Tax=Mariprofundus ferrinatatus TaxID=1921087 RepID=A0A2K8L4Y1_9PROT|nr:OmpH family outer membrane protein [Mariprofundus ferrinatatus]ATX82337.1 periplasmic chaperone for outer membrane proteins Skp [Mariprofundus ferrinatatus]
MNKKIGIRSLLLSMVAVSFVGISAVQAEGLKIGYIDVKSAMENTADHQRGMKRLQALQDQKVKELQALGGKISQQEKDLLGQSMAMSPDRLAQKQQELKAMRTDFQRKQQDAQEALQAEQNRLQMSIGSKFEKVVGSYGKKGGFDMIIAKPVTLYINPKHDITADITKLLDAEK